jgi:hypothetical protein
LRDLALQSGFTLRQAKLGYKTNEMASTQECNRFDGDALDA